MPCIGILTITEKWENYLNTKCSFSTEDYLQQNLVDKEDRLMVPFALTLSLLAQLNL